MLESSSKDEQNCLIYVAYISKMQTLDSAPTVANAAGAPHQHLHRHNMLQWHCGSLLSRTKSSQDMMTSLESGDEVC